ncbi:MAG: HD domain-containing protein [Bdellovibrionales bacterium]
MDLLKHEILIQKKLTSLNQGEDPAHDFLHLKRVVKTAWTLTKQEGADWAVVMPAAWLHDMVVIAKNDSRRSQASRLSGQAAAEFLRQIEYPVQDLSRITHAIEAHSFSAGIEPQTIEARIVQDADRLDGLGAIGVARCFATAGLMKRAFYSEKDPFCQTRVPDDGQFTVDHFYKKLFVVASTLKTAAGQDEGQKRVFAMKRYLADLALEIS